MNKTVIFQAITGGSDMGNDTATYNEPIGFLGEVLPREQSDGLYGWRDSYYVVAEDGKNFKKISKEEIIKAYKGEER